QRVSQFPDKTVIVVPRGESVEEFSLLRVRQATEQIARAIFALLGDQPVVAIYTPNRIEGALVDLACLTNGIFNTMVPANSVESQLEHILIESGARMLIVSGADQLRRALAIRQAIPTLEWIVTLDALPTVSGMNVIPWSRLLERADEVSPRKLEERLGAVRSSTIATTMYTSGTTGLPKGITFSHLNLVSKRYARVAALPEIDENEVFLCFLPLYHTFGRYLELLGSIHLAATYVFAESASTETLLHHLKQFRPTAMISVPKKWVDLHARIVTADNPPDDPEAMTRSVRELTGGRLRWGLSAAGRLDPEIFRFFQRHGIDLLSGYGMTEATGGITMTPPGQYIADSIGRALPGIELGFGEDNELKLRGPYVTTGYTNPEDNAAAFHDGWFCTGDVVSIDEGGYLRHLDRKKDIYKNASGRTIAPQRIEALFADFPEVSRVFAVGDGREYVTLLIRPNLDYAEIELGRMSAEAMREYFRGLVVSCNRFLAPFERVVNFALIGRDFLLEEDELTPKGSFRRATVEDHFRQVIDPMYVSSTTDRVVSGLRIKIPIPFLQQIGATEAGVRAEQDGLLFRAIDRKLPIRRDPDGSDRVWIGNCCYRGVGAVIELDDWLRLPELWVGNADLTQMTGDNILLWSLSSANRTTPGKMVCVEPTAAAVDDCVARLQAAQDAAPSLLTVHAAAVCLASAPQDVALQAVDYLARVLTTGWARHQELAGAHLRYAAHHRDIAVRSRAFAALFEHEPAESFAETAAVFCESLREFLDDDAGARIARAGFSPERWSILSRAFTATRRTVVQASLAGQVPGADRHEQASSAVDQFVVQLLHSLGRIANREKNYYLPVRRELLAWMLAPVSEALHERATAIAEELTGSFRRRLGNRQTRAVDPESGRSY
ncbi:MAG: AMP-binding protein, partial [Planctomycetes bacterium]|nr:AMP-binding protein [Planctomycetota bacterium]